MAVTLNATVSNGLVISPDNSGQIQFQLNGVNVPSPSVAPAFSAYANTNQTLSSATFTKVMFQVKVFDTNNNFDAVTNYRFTPTVAGYYQVNGKIDCEGSGGLTRFFLSIYKNGGEYSRLFDYSVNTTSIGSNPAFGGSSLIYMNGTTDYIELYAYIYATTPLITGINTSATYFQAFLARTA